METNVYRLHDNVVDLDEGMNKLLKVEDERALLQWTDFDKRWSIIQSKHQTQETPPMRLKALFQQPTIHAPQLITPWI